MAEQPSNITSAQRNQNERIDVDAILNAAISTSQPSNYKLHRLGRFNPSNTRPRPIKLVLGNESEVHEIIRHAKNLKNHGTYNTIRLSYDRTPRELQRFKDLKRELNERVSKGENNLKIKYVNGAPKIVHLPKIVNLN